ACFRRAQQNVARFAVLRIVANRIAGIKLARLEQLPGAGKASSLMANRGKIDSRSLGFVPDMFAGPRANHARPVRRDQRHVERLRLDRTAANLCRLRFSIERFSVGRHLKNDDEASAAHKQVQVSSPCSIDALSFGVWSWSETIVAQGARALLRGPGEFRFGDSNSGIIEMRVLAVRRFAR